MFLQHKAPRLYAALAKLLLLILLVGCKDDHPPRTIEPAFYYWKSVLNISSAEKQKLDSLQVRTLYIKFFDVDWDELKRAPVPVAKLQAGQQKMQAGFAVIPTVFITNGCIQKIDSTQVPELASNIIKLILAIQQANAFDSIPEIQIDCDWTAGSREKYFLLLNTIKHTMASDKLTAGIKLSCTIRLHQVKYLKKTGVPPVDRGLLMCYNMGNLYNPATKNSIIETTELKKYVGDLASYPLQLDVAFPLFDWKVLYRNNKYSGLFQQLPAGFFNMAFATKKGNRYLIIKDTLLEGYDLRKGDMIRDEQSDIKEVQAAAAEISRHVRNTHLRVSLYHLDSVILSKYTTHELESIYNSLH